MAENSSKLVFPPRQKRIRHIRSIAGRNIAWKSIDAEDETLITTMPRSESANSLSLAAVEDSSLMKRAYQKNEHHLYSLGLLDAYATLHIGELDAPAFYKSEMIPNTINPTFRSLPYPMDWMDWHEAASSLVIMRLWTRHSIPESAGQHTEPVLGYSETEHYDGFQLLIEWQVDLNALTLIGKSSSDLHFSFPENTLLFELEDGFYSATDILPVNQHKRSSMLELDQKDTASIHSVHSNKTKVKRSCTFNHILKLNTVMDCIADTQQSSDQVRLSIEEVLGQQERGFCLKRELDQHRSKLVELEAQIIQQKRRLQIKREMLKTRQQLLENRTIDLAEAKIRCQSNMDDLQENEHVLEKNIKMRQTTFHSLNRRKKELIADLFSIYPIEQSYDDSQQFRIRGIYLPNSVYDGQNEELIATALGFTTHL
ncbi:hypothetical protein CU098_009428, partial [Rhizopus stolonifer]